MSSWRETISAAERLSDIIAEFLADGDSHAVATTQSFIAWHRRPLKLTALRQP